VHNEEIVRQAGQNAYISSAREADCVCAVQKASKLMGAPVRNNQDEKTRKVDNMLVICRLGAS